jgi:hypothetical protein
MNGASGRTKKVLLLVAFAIAMGYLEAAVVVYLRRLFYPEGFGFPLRGLSMPVGPIEVGREAATVVMLVSLAWLAENTRRGRFATFLLLFGVWDITYYFWLWVVVGWPSSLLTWDILFLIPLDWTGPVLAPVLVSCLMVVTSLLYYVKQDAAEKVSIKRSDWLAAVAGALCIFASFTASYGSVSHGGAPSGFGWEIFSAGIALEVLGLARIWRRLPI